METCYQSNTANEKQVAANREYKNFQRFRFTFSIFAGFIVRVAFMFEFANLYLQVCMNIFIIII